MNCFIFFLSLSSHMPRCLLEMNYHLLQHFTYSQFILFCTAGPTLTCAGETVLLNILKNNESDNQSNSGHEGNSDLTRRVKLRNRVKEAPKCQEN
jgi:hypothetical protein